MVRNSERKEGRHGCSTQDFNLFIFISIEGSQDVFSHQGWSALSGPHPGWKR
jgi:hypothetical protein